MVSTRKARSIWVWAGVGVGVGAALSLGATLLVRDSSVAASQVHGERPVAAVGERLVAYSEIAVAAETAANLCIWSKAGPSKQCTLEEIDARRDTLEGQRLFSLIEGAVRAETMQDLGIAASSEEVAAAWAELSQEWDEAEVEEEVRRLQKTLEAATAVYEGGEDPLAVHERLLADLMTLDAWKLQLAGLESKESRDALAVFRAPRDLLQLDNYDDQGIRSHVMQQKLTSAIDLEIGREDTRFVMSLASLEKPSLPTELAESLGSYVDKARLEWWSRRYQEAGIRILDPQYKQVLAKLLAAYSAETAPN